MLDPEIFAILTAYDNSNLAREALSLSGNVHCYRKTHRLGAHY